MKTALFWRCRSAPDALFKDVVLRFQSDGLDLPAGQNLVEKKLDRNSGLFSEARRVEIGQWRDGVEFAEHWDGMAFELKGELLWSIEILKGPDALVLMVHESEESYRRQAESAHHATRWCGLLLDLFNASRAEACVFPLNLLEVPVGRWPDAVSSRSATAELRIAEKASAAPAPPGYRELRLTSGGVLQTSLPVKSSP